MSRYEVDVTMTTHFSMAIEAPDPTEAQNIAIAHLSEYTADDVKLEFHAQLGADRG